ncbi:MAG: winged-helix domain-containing protein [Telmatospirillum sp.]|nr:winged-helix domain-containing protein [Telmatospirillum sp.]
MKQQVPILDSIGLRGDPIAVALAQSGFVPQPCADGDHLAAVAAAGPTAAVLVVAPHPDAVLEILDSLALVAETLPVLCLCDASADQETSLLTAGVSVVLPLLSVPSSIPVWVEALGRLTERQSPPGTIAGLRLDPVAREACRDGVRLTLRPREFDLLLQLAESGGRAVPADQLARSLWPGQPEARRRLVVLVHGLRAILDSGPGGPILHTMPDGAYLLSPSAPPSRRRVRHRRMTER